MKRILVASFALIEVVLLAFVQFRAEGGMFWIRGEEEIEVGAASSSRRPERVSVAENRSSQELDGLMDQADRAWLDAGHRYWELRALREALIASWTEEEVTRACQELFPCEWEDVLFERWGFLNPQAAIAHILRLPNEPREEYEKAKHSFEGGPGEADVQSVGMVFNAALAGWATRDPREACLVMADPEGDISKSEAFDDYGYLAPIPMFESLSRIDAELAWELFYRERDPDFSGSMLNGMCRGLPSGLDWKAHFEDVMKSRNAQHHDIIANLRGSLLARWMEDDAAAAVEWFRSQEGEVISIEEHEEFVGEVTADPFDGKPRLRVKVSSEVSLASGARHWIARDRGGAFQWIGEHPEVIPDILKGKNWLDRDRVSDADLRFMIANCMDDSEREELLRPLIGKEGLSQLLDQDDEVILKKQISELQLSEEFAKELFESHLRNEADPFGE